MTRLENVGSCAEPCDINEHLPTLRKYASGCRVVGVCNREGKEEERGREGGREGGRQRESGGCVCTRKSESARERGRAGEREGDREGERERGGEGE